MCHFTTQPLQKTANSWTAGTLPSGEPFAHKLPAIVICSLFMHQNNGYWLVHRKKKSNSLITPLNTNEAYNSLLFQQHLINCCPPSLNCFLTPRLSTQPWECSQTQVPFNSHQGSSQHLLQMVQYSTRACATSSAPQEYYLKTENFIYFQNHCMVLLLNIHFNFPLSRYLYPRLQVYLLPPVTVEEDFMLAQAAPPAFSRILPNYSPAGFSISSSPETHDF